MNVIIAIPVYNEALILRQSIETLHNFCQQQLSMSWQIIIADNQSTDQTADIGRALAQHYQEVICISVPQRGKGAAIRAAWQAATADVYCFMDADLATDLSALPLLIDHVRAGNDVVVGSRFHPESHVARTWRRRFYSLLYQRAAEYLVHVKVHDLPCGFKAINSKIKEHIVPQVIDHQWFFDSELVIIAQAMGYHTEEIPITWHDPRERTDRSRVRPLSLGWAYLTKLLQLRWRLQRMHLWPKS